VQKNIANVIVLKTVLQELENGKGHSGGVALNGDHTHLGYTDAIGKMSFNPPWRSINHDIKIVTATTKILNPIA
jgi:hypothetical protein